MYFIDAITYPFTGQRSISVLAIFTVMFIIPFVNIVGLIIALGYASRLIPLIYQGIKDKPEIEFGSDFGRGIMLIIASIVYNIVPTIINVGVNATDDLVIICIGSLLGLVLSIVLGFGFAVAFIRYSLEDGDSSVLFDFGTNLLMPWQNIGATIMLIINGILFYIGALFIILFGFLLLVCPGILAAVGLFLAGSYGYINAQYGLALGIQPSKPLKNPFADNFTGDFSGA